MAAGTKAASRRFLKLLVLSGSLLLSFVFIEVAVRALISVRNVGPSFTSYDPYYGRSLKVNESIRRITPEFDMQMTTNSAGYRGPEPLLDAEETIVFSLSFRFL